MSSLPWREEETRQVSKKPSSGLAPSVFHKSSHNQQPAHLAHTLEHAKHHVVREQRKTVSNQITLKRSSYRELTSLQSWPLQELALTDLDRWQLVHLGQGGDAVLGNEEQTNKKQSKHTVKSSPRQATLRHQFKVAFQQERNFPRHSDPTWFATALYGMEPRIFAQETSHTRKYWVGHVGRFMDHYWRQTCPEARHYYELIREKTPCRLYFDLEFSKIANPNVTEDETEQLMKEFIEELEVELRSVHGLNITRSNVVDLESSTSTKFSRHLIVHLPNGTLFPDAVAAGRFVKAFVGRLAEEQATGILESRRPALYNLLFVSVPKSEKKTCFVDLGVYTRNRLFRLLGSSKCGKPASAALHIATTNQFPFINFTNASFYAPDITQSQMIVTTADDFDRKAFLASLDFTDHAEALAATLIVPLNGSKIDFPLLPDTIDRKVENKCYNVLASRSTVLTMGPSPFPFLDAFVLKTLATRHGIPGSIRAWSIDCNEQGISHCITYQMSRNRWCECVGKCHSSNNIFWKVDLQGMVAIQGCHDPECRIGGFQGTPVPLPEPVIQSLEDALLEEHLAQIDETTLLPRTAVPEVTKAVETCDEFDDDDFERALLALDLNGR